WQPPTQRSGGPTGTPQARDGEGSSSTSISYAKEGLWGLIRHERTTVSYLDTRLRVESCTKNRETRGPGNSRTARGFKTFAQKTKISSRRTHTTMWGMISRDKVVQRGQSAWANSYTSSASKIWSLRSNSLATAALWSFIFTPPTPMAP